GRGARRHDRHAGLLVSGAQRAEADDRSSRLRRWRQSRSDDDPRQEPGGGEGARAEGLVVPAPPRRPRLLRRRPRRRRRRRDAERWGGSLVFWLSVWGLVPAIDGSMVRYTGSSDRSATSHEALDRDAALQQEVRTAATALCETVRRARAGEFVRPATPPEPRP